MNINEILQNEGTTAADKIAVLKEKIFNVPAWNELVVEYDPKKHPIMDKGKYPDLVTADGVQPVTRITLDLQRLVTKRMSELVCGVPIKRVYTPTNDKQKEVARYIENIFTTARIDTLNIERCNMLFAGCEVVTIWYAVQKPNTSYGFESDIKLKCANYSPMRGDELYPLFDEYGDLIALSIGYTRKNGKKEISYFDTYTDSQHIKWDNESGEWEQRIDEQITLGKIPAIYVWRPSPIWEDTSRTVFEMELALSRNGNYLRENSKPLFVVFADEQIDYGDEPAPDKEFRSVMQYPKGSTAQYITWSQAVDNLKFYIEQLRSLFFTQLQLPDWSYEKMSQQALSGESRKQMFIDCQLKVRDESGRLLEFFDREVNVIKAFLKTMLPDNYATDIDTLMVETIITPFSINEEAETIKNILDACGNKELISHREAIERLGWAVDPDKTIEAINATNFGESIVDE